MLASLEAEKTAFPSEVNNLPPAPDCLLGPLPQSVATQQEAAKKETSEITPPAAVPFSIPNLASDLSTRFVAAMEAAALNSKVPFSKLPVMPLPIPPLPPTGWCNKNDSGAHIPPEMGAIPGLPFPPPPPPPPPMSAFAATAMEAAEIMGSGAFKVNEKKKSLAGERI